MEPTYQFWYFPLLSNGELARLTLALAGAEWENKFPDWKAEMDSTPFGQLPVLVINENGKVLYRKLDPTAHTWCFPDVCMQETHLAQPQVIVRYLAARYNLVLQATCTARLVEAVNDTMFDYKQKLSPITWTLKGEELDNAKKELQDTTAPALTKYLLQHIGSYDTFVGDKIDVFELSLYYLMSLTPEGVPGSFTHENASELFKHNGSDQNMK
ncbi:hypothetical protein RI367_004141 [Sorochytrium milnesiophthora]